jgi:hypothetical protein
MSTGIMQQAELDLHRVNTQEFIAANYTELVLTPRTRVKTGTGTTYTDGPPRAPQRMRLIDQTRTFGVEPGTVLAGDGRQRRVGYQLLGTYDAVIGLYDYWVDAEGIRLEVADLLPFNGYERRAQVVRYGE